MQAASFEEAIEQIAARDRRYHREAYFFLREALDHTQKMIGKLPKKNEVRHVSGQELLNGIREYALQQFGPMTLSVFEEWGVTCCLRERQLGSKVSFIGASPLLVVPPRHDHQARKHGLLTRPIRDTIVLMPPYCITDAQLEQCVEALAKAVIEICGA